MKKNSRRKNPLILNDDNIRRWSFINVPKSNSLDELNIQFLKYFKIPIYLSVGPLNLMETYFVIWRNLNVQYDSKTAVRKWREYLLYTDDSIEIYFNTDYVEWLRAHDNQEID